MGRRLSPPRSRLFRRQLAADQQRVGIRQVTVSVPCASTMLITTGTCSCCAFNGGAGELMQIVE
jgi:hypothetical protein